MRFSPTRQPHFIIGKTVSSQYYFYFDSMRVYSFKTDTWYEIRIKKGKLQLREVSVMVFFWSDFGLDDSDSTALAQAMAEYDLLQ